MVGPRPSEQLGRDRQTDMLGQAQGALNPLHRLPAPPRKAAGQHPEGRALGSYTQWDSTYRFLQRRSRLTSGGPGG